MPRVEFTTGTGGLATEETLSSVSTTVASDLIITENNEQWFVRMIDTLERIQDQLGLMTGISLGKNERID